MSDQTEGMSFEEGEGFTFDMQGTDEAAGFEPIAVGTYNATIEEAEFKISKSSGSPMWSIKWAISDEPHASANRKAFSFVSFKPEQHGRAKQFIMRVAPHLNIPNFNPKTIAEQGQLVGLGARLRIGIQMYEGRKTNNVKEVMAPLGAGGFAQG